MSVTEKLGSSVTGLVRWFAVFLVGFIVGYGMMSVMIEEPSAEELPLDLAAPVPEPEPIELPTLDVAAEPLRAVAPLDTPGTASEATTLEPEIIDTADATPEIPRPWWEACQDRRCRLDFGGISGNLTIRKATVVHGSTVHWDQDLATKPRIESLPTERPLEVHVQAIAMNREGNPVAAEIVWTRRGRAIRGVITLDLGEPGKRIVMHP